ncbi:MAG: YicC family protein [bacterium]|nr:YicC family protein [bacterium]
MIRSMTGYGRANGHINNCEIQVDLKSVNHKGLEISVHAPKELAELEATIYSYLAKQIQRGRLDMYITVTSPPAASQPNVMVDTELARYYLNSLQQLARDLQIADEIKLAELVSLPGVIRLETRNQVSIDSDTISWENLEPIIAVAVAELTAVREREGDSLAEDIYSRLTQIEFDVEKIKKLVPEVVNTYQQRLRARLATLIENQEIDPIRIAQEIALLAERSDITEELVRIESHLDQFRNTMESDGAIGRRLDFILQELFREVSTAGAKANHSGIAELIVDIKTELDKVKQQIQNIE